MRAKWDALLSELCGGSDDPDAGRLANEIEREVRAIEADRRSLAERVEKLEGVVGEIEGLRRSSKGAEPGEWWVDDFKVEYGFGQHYAYALANPMGKHIADTINGDLIVIEQDDGPRRDVAGSRNLEFAASCVNVVRAALAALERP